MRTFFRFIICSVLASFWVYFFILLYPDFLAYYEYNHDLAEETIGVIDKIESGGGQHRVQADRTGPLDCGTVQFPSPGSQELFEPQRAKT